MALWGNNDSVAYLYQGAVGGTVSVNYSTKVVTGTGTTFGSDGYAKEGDVIRIGFRGTGGTYFGDATITSIASTTSLTIASTDGLSGAAIANTSYWVSELPQYTPQNPRYSEDPTFNRETQGFKQIFTGTASTFAGIGVSVLPVNLTQAEIDGNVAAGDFILVDGESIEITGIATANVRVSGTQSIGTTRYYVKAGDDGLPALSANSAGSMYRVFTGTGNTITQEVTGVGGTFVDVSTPSIVAVTNNTLLMFESSTLSAIGIAQTISASISTDAIYLAAALVAPHGGLGSSCPIFRNGLLSQAVAWRFNRCTLTVSPLRSKMVNPFPATMRPSDSRTNNTIVGCGSLRFLDFSFAARCLQPPRGVRRVHINVTSPSVSDFSQ